jgi:carbon storage regulator
MLVVSRKEKQRIVVAENIKVTIVAIRGSRVKLGIEAPPSVPIRRCELQPRISRELTPPSFEGSQAEDIDMQITGNVTESYKAEPSR